MVGLVNGVMVTIDKARLVEEDQMPPFSVSPSKGWDSTVKFQNFRTPENFAVMDLNFKQRGQSSGYFIRIANSKDPDQTAPLGAV